MEISSFEFRHDRVETPFSTRVLAYFPYVSQAVSHTQLDSTLQVDGSTRL